MHYFVTLLLCFVTPLLFGQFPPPTYADLDYVGDGDERHLLDVYIPNDSETDRPCVVFIHGGSWSTGSKGTAMRLLEDLWANHGFVVVDVNYRLTSQAPFPAQTHDNKSAVRYLKANAEELGIDTCRIGVLGKSAGGHLAALLALSQNVEALEGIQFGNTEVTSEVHAVVAIQGAYDFERLDESFPEFCGESSKQDRPGSSVTKLLGCQISDCPDVAMAASPITYIGSDEPPFAIFHGAQDCKAPAPQSELLHQELIEAGNEASIQIFPDAGHAGIPEAELVANLTAFFVAELGPDVDCGETVTTALTERPTQEVLVSLFPNPATEIVTIVPSTGKVLTDAEVRVFSVSGKEFLRATNVELPLELDISQLPAGYYVIQLRGENFFGAHQLSVVR